MGSLSQITSDQENESIWKILAIEIDHQILALKYRILSHNALKKG